MCYVSKLLNFLGPNSRDLYQSPLMLPIGLGFLPLRRQGTGGSGDSGSVIGIEEFRDQRSSNSHCQP